MSPDLYWETPDEVLILNGTRYVREGEPVSELSPLDALADAIRLGHGWPEQLATSWKDLGSSRNEWRRVARAAVNHLLDSDQWALIPPLEWDR